MKIILTFWSALSLWACMQEKPAQTVNKSSVDTIQVVQKTTTNLKKDSATKRVMKKYGFQFAVPKTWKVDLNDFKAIDLKGNVKTITSSFVDTVTNARVQLVYHPNKAGVSLYKYYRKKNAELVKIAHQDAVKITRVLKTDGKGHPLQTPLVREKIILMTPDQSGSLEMILDVKQNDQKAFDTWQDFLQHITAIK